MHLIAVQRHLPGNSKSILGLLIRLPNITSWCMYIAITTMIKPVVSFPPYKCPVSRKVFAPMIVRRPEDE